MNSMLELGILIVEEGLMEAGFSQDIKNIYNKTMKYEDRFKYKFTIKNLDKILQNLFVNAQRNGNFEKIRPNLLTMVKRCDNIKDLEYLSRDRSAGIRQLSIMAKNRPDIRQQCLDHIEWLKNEYKDVIAERRKELKN